MACRRRLGQGLLAWDSAARGPGERRQALGARQIHARAEMTALNQRQKQLLRPAEQGSAASRFVLAPTVVQGGDPWRRTRQQRQLLQLCKSSAELLRHVDEAIGTDAVDASVFSAAMQRCGQGRWWEALLRVRALQEECGVVLDPIGQNILMRSLAQCVRGEHGFGPVQDRRDAIVQLGRQAWEGCSQDSISLSAALNLCAVADRVEGSRWADELLVWAQQQNFVMNTLCYTALALVFATHGPPEHVDDLLAKATQKAWTPDEVTLGALVNASAEQRDWHRAEDLWKKLVVGCGVKPHVIAFAARAKAHLLSGRPAVAAEVIDEMYATGIKVPTLPAAEMHVQALLLVYHSNLDRAAWERLQQAFRRGEPLMEKASLRMQNTWSAFKRVAGALEQEPASVRLRDVLVKWGARESVMVQWPDYAAGSMYVACRQKE